MDKENTVYTHNHTLSHTLKYYSAIIRNEVLPFVTRMDLKHYAK